MRDHDEQQTFQQIAGVFDEPAFIRRARRTEDAWLFLLERCEREYVERLRLPLMRVARLAMLTDGFRLHRDHLEPASLVVLMDLCQQHAPKLKRHISPTAQDSEIAKELTQLIESFERFNRRWRVFVGKLNYAHVNTLRDGYNKYYVLEKECALQSFRTASSSFRPLPFVNEDDVLQRFPLLSEVRKANK